MDHMATRCGRAQDQEHLGDCARYGGRTQFWCRQQLRGTPKHYYQGERWHQAGYQPLDRCQRVNEVMAPFLSASNPYRSAVPKGQQVRIGNVFHVSWGIKDPRPTIRISQIHHPVVRPLGASAAAKQHENRIRAQSQPRDIALHISDGSSTHAFGSASEFRCATPGARTNIATVK